jgi:hypothetical protein
MKSNNFFLHEIKRPDFFSSGPFEKIKGPEQFFCPFILYSATPVATFDPIMKDRIIFSGPFYGTETNNWVPSIVLHFIRLNSLNFLVRF